MLPLALALDFSLWQKAVTIKTEGALDFPSKQCFLQMLKDSVKVKPLSASIQNMLLVKTIVMTITQELGMVQKLVYDSKTQLKSLKL